MRYTASTLRGCLIELLARFRHRATAEERIDEVAGVHRDENTVFGLSLAADIGAWLALQRVGVCHLDELDAEVLSVNDAKLLADLNHHPASAPRSKTSGSAAPSIPESWTAPPSACLARSADSSPKRSRERCTTGNRVRPHWPTRRD